MDSKFNCFLLAALVTFASSAEDKEETCTLFLNNNGIKHHLSSSDVAATACPCVETKVALDYSFKKINNCYQEWFYNDHGLKQMCCYSDTGEILSGAPLGGYLSVKSYSENISKAHEACCQGNNSRCKLFYDINPSDDCSRYNQPDIVKSWGDPTITTVDKFVYDFNGHGEYWFLITGDVEIQARTEYVTMGNTDATMFTAFVIYNSALKEQVELHLNRSSKLISVYRHGVYLGDSSKPTLSPLSPPNRNECFLLAGAKKVVVLNCGLQTFCRSVTFSAADFMSVGISMISRKSETLTFSGLAEPRISGELILGDGSTVSENASAATLFDFGESWALEKESDSRFNYSITAGKNFTSFNSNHTRPRFLEELVGNLTALFPNATHADIDKYNTTCRNYWDNDPNKQCLLTIARTGDYSLGVAIMKTANETQLLWEMKHNHRPNFNANMLNKLKVVLTEYSRPYKINLTNYVNDSDSNEVFRFTIETAIPKSDYELGDGQFQWTIKKSLRNITTSLDISFHVFDKFNKTTSHTLQIDFCGCEHGNSECDFTKKNNASGIIAKCKCDIYYKGVFCEEKVDPCSLNTCYRDPCNHSAEVGDNPCLPCPDGYQGDGRVCTDVDECELSYNGTDKCEQNCTNTEGSFTCVCLPTYTLDDDNYTCSDIDECKLGRLSCSSRNELCVNTIGSAHCACVPGYIRKTSNGSCESVNAEDKEEMCTLFLNDNDIKHQLTSSGVTATACPCVEMEIALDYSFKKIDNCYFEWFYDDNGLKQMCCYSDNGDLLTGAPVGGYLSLKSYSENISKAHEACCHGNNRRCKLFYDINPSDDCSRYKQSYKAEDKEEICTLFLKDNNIKHQLSSSGVKSTACPCVETEIALDYSFKKINNCYQEWFYDDHGLKQMCCYSDSGDLMTGAPVGGYLSLKSYSEKHSKAHEACCHGNNSICKLFYDVNPSDDCSRYKQPDIVKSWGDPTITTVDKFVYDFNGHGEYWFLITGDIEIQARTEYVTMGNTDATMFTAFVIYNSALKEQVELHLNRSSKLISVYRHGVHLGDSSKPNISPFGPPNRNECFLQAGAKKVVVLSCGLQTFSRSVTFSATDFLSVDISMISGKSETLTFSGLAEPRISGELILGDNSTVSENASAATLFDFGESWALEKESDSRFNYSITAGKNFTSYNSNHTRPRFLEELVGNLTALFPNATHADINEYNTTCRNYWNNEPNKQCLLTIARTGDYSLGVAIMKKENETQLLLERKHNHRPSFNDDMPNKLKVILTEYSSPYIIDLNNYVNDSDSKEVFRFTVETAIPKSDYELGIGEFQWTIKKSLRNITTSLDIKFHVFDKFNKTASHTLQIDFCGCEHGNSECDFAAENNVSGIIAKCKCDIYYKGVFCEEKVDPCSLNTCYRDPCNPLAEVGENPCLPCPDGYQGDGRVCTDVDECEVSYNGTDKCGQKCTNIVGGFTCGCLPTYTLNNDSYTCSDIDECKLGTKKCSSGIELCVNTIGSAHCACVPGYIRKTANGSCESVKGTLQYAGYMIFSVSTDIKLTTLSAVNTLKNREAINVEMDTWYKGTKNYIAVEVYMLHLVSNSRRRRRDAGSDSTKLEVDFILYGSNGTTKEIGAAIEQSYTNYKTGHRDIETVITVAGEQVSLRPDGVSMRLPNEFGMCNMTDRTDCDTTTVCKNTNGGFECQCLSGYKKNTTSTNQCLDIDECNLFKANSTSEQRCVQGICKNGVGTWTCECPSYLERQRVSDASYLVYRCQGNYSYIGHASLTVRGIANDTDIINTIEGYLTNYYRNQSLEGKAFTVPISNLLVSTTVLTLKNEKNFTNGTMPFTAVFKLRMGEEVEVQRVADVLSKVVGANAIITGNSFNATIVTAHIYTDEENMLCTLSNNADCDVSTTRCQQGNGSTSCQCKVGYERKNNKSCTVKHCGSPSKPDNGRVELTNNQTFFNSTATFECNKGFYLDGDKGSICTSSGHWSSNASCLIRDCGILSKPKHGHVVIANNTTTYQSTANFSCDVGYYLDGGNEISICESNGNWSSKPTCLLHNCGNLTIQEHGTVYFTNNLTTFNSSATFSCDTGYELTTNNDSECNSSGMWTNEPQCEIKDCPQLHEPHNGHVYQINDTRTYGSMAIYECSRGYSLSGSNIAHCESSGNWSDIRTCNIKDCGLWSDNTTNGNNKIAVKYENNQTYGSTATADCVPGYHVKGSMKTKSVAVCQHDANWSASVPMCVQTVCHDINVTDSNVKHDKVSKPYLVNTTTRFTCPDGYNIKGFQDLMCLSSSQWSHDAPTCVKVAEGVPNCTHDKEWATTKPGTTLMKGCLDEYEGSITRQCSENGQWMQPINGCVHKNIILIKDTVDDLPDKISDPLMVTDVLLKLENISNQDQSGSTAKTIREFTELTSILSSLVTKSGGLNVSATQSKPFLDTTSNLLDVLCSIYCGTDKSSPEESSEIDTKATSQLLETVNRYTDVVARSLNETNSHVTIPAKNLVMHVRRIKDTGKDVIFPTEEDHVNVTSSVSIPYAALNGLTGGKISVVIYDILNKILSTSAVQNGTKYTGINSQVMAVDIKGWQKNPEFKLNMTFNHFNLTSKTAGIPHCSFFVDKDNSRWNTTGCTLVKSASNSNKSVCECEHLTNFAILMSPWIPPSDADSLDIISIIGCSMSLLGLLVTMIMHLACWRYVKSDKVVILMNLCLALIISYAIFLGGVDQTQNKDACTVVAVLLQYIYLVVVFLMLAEAIELAVTVLYVFSTSSRLKWLVPLAWFLPAMITGVSVGSSQLEGYGNEQFCWLSIEDGLIWAFVVPAFTIIIVTFVLLVLVMKAMFNAQTLAQKSLSQQTKTGVRCLCVLLPLMGITWVIGIFYVNEETVWIQYVFAVCNSLQGLIIFIFHCALNTQIRRAVRRKPKQYTDSM